LTERSTVSGQPLAIVPAAGKAERFGGAKLLADVGGRPMLDRTIASLLDAGVGRVVVVLSPGARERFTSVAALGDARVSVAVNRDPDRGMFSSILTGLAGAEGDPILVLPGDMPFVRPETVKLVADRCLATGRVVTPRRGDARGHPAALPGRLRTALLDADPLWNLSAWFAANVPDRLMLDVDDPGVLRDVDRPGDLAAPRGDID